MAVLLLPSVPQIAAAQYPTPDTNYMRRLPNYRWVDDSHYEMVEANGRNSDVTDAATGKTIVVPSFRGSATNGRIAIRREDIAWYDATGKQQKVTGIHNPMFSPDSAKIAFTRNNDLYVYDTASRQEWRVTNDGSKDVYNGYSSWVYNEEILGRKMNYRAFWWSPDGRHIAFMRFDDSKVPVYDHFDDQGVHGKHVLIHYPQPGDPNPSVKMGVADIAARKITWAGYDENADQYFGAPYWKPDGSALWVQWMNRRQDTLKIDEMNLTDGRLQADGGRQTEVGIRNIYTEAQSTWIDLDQENRITFVPEKNLFLLMSDRSGWMHVYAYDMNGKLIRQLTSGDWTVTEINHVDAKKGEVIFTARKENSTRFDLYKVKLNGTGLQRLTFGAYSHRAQLSPAGSYFITSYSSFDSPARLALLDRNGKLIRELGDSRGVDFGKYLPLVRKSEIIRVRTSDGFALPVRIMWPARLDTTKKYPLMAGIYGGPNFSFVSDGYSGGFSLADDTASDMISVQMDHRGSGQFGKMGQNCLYHQLGKWEIEDYTTIIRYLERTYSFIDTSRIGISGFSYGGYVTCLALTKAADVFNYGLAGGSVTDWRLYDAPYTERYMGTPESNPEGYKSSSVMTYVKNYRGLLRLAQGTMDDNVHMQNTIQLASALEDAGKHFEMMLYPGGAHGWLSLHEKYAHYRAEDLRFIRQYLLNKNPFEQKPVVQKPFDKTPRQH